jgi:tetratricopeptide (TPR) repeat protein
MNLGFYYKSEGRLDEAEAVFMEVLRRNPGSSAAALSLAKTFLVQGKIKEAESAFMEALRNRPGNVEAASNLAKIFLDTGRAEASLQLYEQLAALKPDDPGFQEGRRNAMLALKNAHP